MLTTELQNGVLLAKLSHGKANALDLELCQELIVLIQHWNAAEEIKSVVLCSAGRIFSGGVDLVRFVEEPPEYAHRFYPKLVELFQMIFRFPKPLVAEVNGSAIAGGCVLASGSDFRLIIPTAKIGISELRVGVPLPVWGMEIMRSVTSPAQFQNMVNIGSTWTGADAINVGLADQVIENDLIVDAAIAKAEELSQIPANVFSISKRQLRKPIEDRIIAASLEFDHQVEAIWFSSELRAVVKKYVQSRLKKQA